jgi:hypothetical protein
MIEDIVGRPVPLFAYPYGRVEDFSRRTVRLARKAGFLLACANVPGTVSRGTDRFRLPRYVVRDWDGDTFEKSLKDWLGEPTDRGRG